MFPAFGPLVRAVPSPYPGSCLEGFDTQGSAVQNPEGSTLG